MVHQNHLYRFGTVILYLLVTTVNAQSPEPYVVHRFAGSFRLDGIPDEPSWATIAPLVGLMYRPTHGAPASERSEARLAYDEEFLYVAGYLYESAPQGVQGVTFQRDAPGNGGDWFSINFDTFSDKENSLNFATTPTANRIDFTIANDAQGSNWVNFSWNTFWYCVTSRSAEGWFAEFKIPLSSLRYQDQQGRVSMGMSWNRRIARKNEMVTFPLISTQWGESGYWKPSQMQPIVFEQLFPRKPVYLTPYGLAGHSLSRHLSEDLNQYETDQKPTLNVGLDAKIGLTSNLTADLTFNTDFAQVEADDQQVNLTRFSFFFPEKRLFFQERSSIFNFSFGEPNQLFYSRRIGLHNGQPVPILAGVRVVGRMGPWDVGLMDMQTARQADLPSENMGVLRLRRQVFNPNSYLGLMTTSRVGSDGRYNFAYGLDGILRLFRQDFLTINWAQTFEQGLSNGATSLDASRMYLKWEKRIQKGFGYNLSFSRAGREYRPGLGFEFRPDYTRFGDRIFWGWLPGKNSPLFSHQVGLDGYVFIGNREGRTESIELAPNYTALFQSGFQLKASAYRSYENLTDSLPLPGQSAVPVGEHHFTSLLASLETPGAKAYTAKIVLEGGQFYDGHRWAASLTPGWAFSRYVEVSAFLQYNRVVRPQRELLGAKSTYDIALARLRARLMLNIKVSLEAFVQYNNATHLVSSNVRFRYNPREGNDLYIVFNQGNNTNRYRSELTMPLVNERTVVVKYTYTFVW